MTEADFHLPRPLRRVLAPLARIVCTDEIEVLGLTDAVLDHVELMLRAIPSHLRAGILAGTTAFELGALALPSSRGRTFSRLGPTKQEAYFKSWWESPLFPMRQWAKGVKGLLTLSYYEQEAVRRRMEYHPERWIAEVAARRLRDYADDIRKNEALVVAPDPLVDPARLASRIGKGARRAS